MPGHSYGKGRATPRPSQSEFVLGGLCDAPLGRSLTIEGPACYHGCRFLVPYHYADFDIEKSEAGLVITSRKRNR